MLRSLRLRSSNLLTLLLSSGLLLLAGCARQTFEQQVRQEIKDNIAYTRQAIPKISETMSDEDSQKFRQELFDLSRKRTQKWNCPKSLVKALGYADASHRLLNLALNDYYDARHPNPQVKRLDPKIEAAKKLQQASSLADSAESFLEAEPENINDPNPSE